jgi:SAM-dependent methyltransferase
VIRQQVRLLLRRLHLFAAADVPLFAWRWACTAAANRSFRLAHPGFAIPPARVLYDATASLDLRAYHDSGCSSASFVAGLVAKHLASRPAPRVLEWGCGPTRCLRHMLKALPGARLTGTDVSPAAIAWCRRAFPSIAFAENGIRPPLPFADDSFDVVYAISVFTHLSEDAGLAWMAELRRVVSPGGLVIFTTRGDTFLDFLTPAEATAYRARGVAVTTDDGREGKKHYLSHHHERFVRGPLAEGFEVVEAQPARPGSGLQDAWVFRKRQSPVPLRAAPTADSHSSGPEP